MRKPIGTGVALIAALAACAHAAAEESLVVIDSRPGAKEVLVLTPSSAAGEPRNVVIVLTGGSGQIMVGTTADGLESGKLKVAGGFPVAQRQQLADGVGMVATLSPPSDHPMDIDWRDTREHVADIAAAVETMHARLPRAKVWLLGHSNGAWSAARAGAALQDKMAGIVMMAGAEGAFATEGFAQIRIPVLVVHHRRDACLDYRPAAVGAAGHTLLTVDDARLRKPAMPGDCSGETGAHLFSGKEAAVIAAVAGWINTGHAPERID